MVSSSAFCIQTIIDNIERACHGQTAAPEAQNLDEARAKTLNWSAASMTIQCSLPFSARL